MGFGQAVATCLQKYAVFSGRARRSEYWYFVLAYTIVGFVAGVLDGVIAPHQEMGPASLIAFFGLVLPSWAALVRRLHDTDRSGWWSLMMFVPLVGLIVMIIFAIQKGTAGPNRFGPDPLVPLDGAEAIPA